MMSTCHVRYLFGWLFRRGLLDAGYRLCLLLSEGICDIFCTNENSSLQRQRALKLWWWWQGDLSDEVFLCCTFDVLGLFYSERTNNTGL